MPPPTRADLFARTWRALERENSAALLTAYDELHRNSDAAETQIEALAATVAASVDAAEAGLEGSISTTPAQRRVP
jgi:hypothetical protein